MTIPVLVVEGFLLASIYEALEDDVALQLKRDVLDGLRRSRANGVLIDVSGVDIVDSFTASVLGSIGGVARLMGARTVLVGLQPEVAMTMVELGLALRDVATELNVDRGLEYLRAQTRPGPRSEPAVGIEDASAD
jgi:rsbT antagonist protein RsbS